MGEQVTPGSSSNSITLHISTVSRRRCTVVGTQECLVVTGMLPGVELPRMAGTRITIKYTVEATTLSADIGSEGPQTAWGL